MAVKQTVVSDTNSPRTLTFSKLRGVDYSSSPFEVAPSRATSMKNMINEDGVNHKRHGWSQDTEINKKIDELGIKEIRGIYVSNNESSSLKYIIATVWKIYVFTTYNSYTFELTQTISTEYIVKFIPNKNKIIMFYPGAIYSFDLNTSKFESTVDGDAYVPTTTISINPISEESSTRSSFEYANLLNKLRKNTLLGKKESDFNIVYFTIDTSGINWTSSYIASHSIEIKKSTSPDTGGVYETTRLRLPFDGMSSTTGSVPLRSKEDEISVKIVYDVFSIGNDGFGQGAKIICKVYDEKENVLYDTSNASTSDFFTIKTSESGTFRIVYTTEEV